MWVWGSVSTSDISSLGCRAEPWIRCARGVMCHVSYVCAVSYVAGVEGTAATNSSDYAVGTFRMLHTLLFVHVSGAYNSSKSNSSTRLRCVLVLTCMYASHMCHVRRVSGRTNVSRCSSTCKCAGRAHACLHMHDMTCYVCMQCVCC